MRGVVSVDEHSLPGGPSCSHGGKGYWIDEAVDWMGCIFEQARVVTERVVPHSSGVEASADTGPTRDFSIMPSRRSSARLY